MLTKSLKVLELLFSQVRPCRSVDLAVGPYNTSVSFHRLQHLENYTERREGIKKKKIEKP